MKIRKKIGDLGKEQIQQLVQDFLDELGEGAVALLEHFEERDCPEYLAVELDEEEKVVSFTAMDGSHYAYNLKSETIDALAQALSDLADEVHNIPQLENFENIEDSEGRLQIGKDAEDKIFNYRKPDGTLVENVGIETNHLELTGQGMTDFQKALKDAGFAGDDWSDRENIELPEPKHYALLNINIDSLPILSGDVREAWVQYYDGLGNYFKMDAEIEIQGQTSRIFAQTGGKGNYTLDLSKDVKFGNWVPQDSFHLKGNAKDVVRGILPTSYKWAYLMQEYLGSKPNRVLIDESGITTTAATGERINDWPNDARCLPDGFPCELYVNGEYWGLYSWQLKKHRKNYSMDKKDYTSFFIDADSMMSDDYQHGIWNDGPDSSPSSGIGTWWNGFDIKGPSGLVSMNGEEFDGDAPIELMGSDNVYQKSFTLNNVPTGYAGGNVVVSIGSNTYTISTTASMSAEDIIDAIVAGNYTNSRYACYKAKASTTAYKAVFKDLDGRLNPPEPTLVSTDISPLTFIDKVESITYDNSNKAHKNSNITKGLIRTFSTRYLEVRALIVAEDIEQAKVKFNEYFDYDACMLVYIYNCLMKNGDSIKKNTLWGMYKEGKIFPTLWDLDGMYGQGWVGDAASYPSAGLWSGAYATSEWPLKLFWTLYETEIKAVYSALRDAKKIDINTWHDIVFNQWVNRIGEEAYKRDIKKWPETPSYRENHTNTEYWRQIGWTSAPGSLPIWTEGTTYSQGTRVIIKSHPAAGGGYVLWMMYDAIQTTNTCPVTKFYTEFPVVGGFYDSPKRWQKWMEEQIKLCDVQNDYFEELLADFTAYRVSDEGYEIECTNMIVDTKLSKEYNYIQGHITKHETVIEGQTVSTYTIDGGAETPEDTSKTYTTVRAAIEAAASQPVDIPSENVYYIQARAKNINYHKK